MNYAEITYYQDLKCNFGQCSLYSTFIGRYSDLRDPGIPEEQGEPGTPGQPGCDDLKGDKGAVGPVLYPQRVSLIKLSFTIISMQGLQQEQIIYH